MERYEFVGRLSRIVFDSESYKVYGMYVDSLKYPNIKQNKYNNVTITGELPELDYSQSYEITAYEEQGKYGVSYRVINIRCDIPRSEMEMQTFLSEILTANQASVLYNVYPDIVDRVRNNQLDDIDLSKLKGIKEYTFNKIKQKIIENFCLADLIMEFNGHLSLAIIKRLYDKYHSITTIKSRLKKNPYKCLCGISHIGFKTADKILLDIEKASQENVDNGKEPIICFDEPLITSMDRCLSCIIYLLQENENEGNTKMNLVKLRSECLKIVPECVDKFTDAIKSDEIYYNKPSLSIALYKTYQKELFIANTIVKMALSTANAWYYDTNKYKEIDGITLSEEQLALLKRVCENNISILNGSAGVGKSMSTIALIKMLEDNKLNYKLMSPTGKAAKVISSYTHRNATTIHRGLCYDPKGVKYCNGQLVTDSSIINKDENNEYYFSNFQMNKYHKLKTDILIIDEFSMVDLNLFYSVLEAIDTDKTKLLLIGDNAQLPSVGCGNLLHDLMQSDIIPKTTLTKVFRYSEGGLMKVATDVRMSKQYLSPSMKSKATVFGKNKDYMFVDQSSDQIAKQAVAAYQRLLSKEENSVENIQVLTAKNVGDCGADQLNSMIQKIANPNYESETKIKLGECIYYIGDFVIQKVNNYKATLYNDDAEEDSSSKVFIANGETGIIEQIINNKMAIINFDGLKVIYDQGEMSMIGLAYAITIHKSQGSSIDNVILCTPQSHTFMLNSNIIYVGLTRMKKQCIHLGTYYTINNAIQKKANLQRHTFLVELLNEFSYDKSMYSELPF